MKGDFSRKTFDPRKHFSRVLMQQGRVQLDADWNEQSALLLHYARTLAADLIGPHGGPAHRPGFEIAADEDTFTIGPGRYYVQGIPCQNEMKVDEQGNVELLSNEDQPGYPFPDSEELEDGEQYLVYLDVWERHITYIEDPSIREVALGGPDTATRTKVIWQVKVVQRPAEHDEDENEEDLGELEKACRKELAVLSEPECERVLCKALADSGKLAKPTLRAQAYVETAPEDACITPPEARYRGAENQLYRVEVHHGGTADNGATFKWAGHNGSVVAAWIGREGEDLIVSGVRDRARGFAAGQWVELTNDELELRGKPGTMVQVLKAEGDRVTIDPEAAGDGADWGENLKNPKVRRWDHEASESLGVIPVQEGKWLDLEDGIRVQFEAGGTYHSGDYWLIPARTATGDVEWPKERDEEGKIKRDADGNPIPRAMPPDGIEHHYAPLAIMSMRDDEVEVRRDCRRTFRPLTELP